MLRLIETVIGFAAIMLVLSFLVKSLTSVIKQLVDFYTNNLKYEVNKLVRGTLGKTWEALKKESKEKEELLWVHDINWKRLGEEYLTKDNMEWVLNKLGSLSGKKEIDLKDLEGRLAVHVSNIRYAFQKRIKNITLVVGLGVCLALNINAFSIWSTLYKDQQMRSDFAGAYAEEALALVERGEEEGKNNESSSNQADIKASDKKTEGLSKNIDRDQEKKEIQERTQAILKQLEQFQADVSFGVGRIWRDPPKENDWLGLLYELLGSLLTGIFISIGAPYWHDLLRTLAAIRRPKKTSKPADENE